MFTCVSSSFHTFLSKTGDEAGWQCSLPLRASRWSAYDRPASPARNASAARRDVSVAATTTRRLGVAKPSLIAALICAAVVASTPRLRPRLERRGGLAGYRR